LIVEFAIQRHAAGKSVLEAAMEGAKARFRPILMTSFAFIAGLLPLVFATGPGKIGNRTSSRRRDAYWYHLWCICYSWLVLHLWSNRREIQAGKSEEENPLTEEIDNNEVHK
jgi:HAE1 family hydrophobic/amphiphilic exporter-1